MTHSDQSGFHKKIFNRFNPQVYCFNNLFFEGNKPIGSKYATNNNLETEYINLKKQMFRFLEDLSKVKIVLDSLKINGNVL